VIVAGAKWLLGGLAALLGISIASKASGAGAPVAGGVSKFREALVALALADVDRIVESGGKNRGPEIDAALAEVGQAPGQNWCAALLSRWVRRAFQIAGVSPKFAGTAGAKATGYAAAAAGELVKAPDMNPENCPPGTIVFWDRSPGEPFSSWEGHIGVLIRWTSPASFVSAEANSGAQADRVALMPRRKDDPRLIGGAVVS
jgi:hypothetical protein